MALNTYSGPRLVAVTARSLVAANWSTVCDATWCTGMGVPGLVAPVEANIYISERPLFEAETQPAFGFFVASNNSVIEDGLGAMDQSHMLELVVTSDWGAYDSGVAVPLCDVGVGETFTQETYESCLRAYIEGVVMILTSPTYGLTHYDIREETSTGIFRCDPIEGIAPRDFVVDIDEVGRSVTQQTVRSVVKVYQRRALAR